ncbi:M20/M25/M40 family metallo-hydrolase [Blastococcus mobilis]|uniref:Zn-dependent amino- or carboxypeptidase, M28 family n=1 Tax=Blastococcus mobilis TaxID=1938746 RepID=A0A238VGI7_9ACTN|nr:M20/M25/M40 family metallo-hydrolase [Blastococcus mobilis]SNR33522.1 Zn-dependent amino- or carboxypeptidase, M28 family [Blastococcus mobilis]
MPAARSRTAGRRSAGRPRRSAGLVLTALLLGLTGWSVAALQPPGPAPADAPATEFSATRALAHVQEIASGVHVPGSAASEGVVDGLVETLTGLGLDTRVQNAVGAVRTASGETRMASVRNVVGYLPGTRSTGRLFLTAHHDSVATGPGAADDAAGVAAVLEAVRALTTGPRLRNDVVVVFTDAEEACTCGAEAFAAAHPLASAGGVVLNLEARGTGGPPIMFETSPGNAGLADAYAAAAPHPVASSFAVEVYRALPNSTDFSMLMADGDFTGLNVAFIDGVAAYHTPQDVPERLDRGTLQALGDNALAIARELGSRDLTALASPGADDATYFPVLGELVRYPGTLVWPLAGAALVAVGLLVLVVHRRGSSSLRRTMAGTLLTTVPLVLAPLAAEGLWALLAMVRPGYEQLVDPWRPGWFRVATVALVAGVVLSWYAVLRRRVGADPLAAGALVWLAVLTAVLAAVAPGGAYLTAWPALAGALAGLLAAVTSSPAVRIVTALLSGAVAVVVLAPTVALLFPALGLSAAAAPSAVVTLLLLALLPALDPLFPDPERAAVRGSWLPVAAVPATALVVAVACTVVGLQVDRFDADHPVPSRLAYVLDQDTGLATWVSTESTPGVYTAEYVGSRFELPVEYPHLGGEVWSGRAAPADLPAAGVETVSDTVVGGRREVTVRISPQRPAVRMMTLDLRVEGGRVATGRVAGRAVPEAELGRDRAWIVFHAPPEGGLRATFGIDGDGAVDLRVIEASNGLEGLPGREPRPDGVDAAGSHSADLVLVAATTALG